MGEMQDRFRSLVAGTTTERARVRQFVAEKRPLDAEPDQERAADYVSRQIVLNLQGREAQVGPTNDLQAAWFLTSGAAARRAVGYLEVTYPTSIERGTGFLISPSLLMTNQHVIRDAAAARQTIVTFDNERDERNRPAQVTVFELDPDRCAVFSDERELDYAVIAIGARALGQGQIAEFGFCPISNRPDKHAIGMNVNIVQHPGGLPKMIALRNNILQYRTPRTLLYETDTDHGSSGAPVFNDAWEIVALHHYGEPFLERVDENGRPIPATINEGVRISTIYDDLAAKLPTLNAQAQALLREALSLADKAGPAMPDKKLSPPRPSGGLSESLPLRQEALMTTSDQEFRISVPLEITVRIGKAGSERSALAAGPVQAPTVEKTLARGAEGIRIDTDYASRKGYDSTFIPGVEIPLPAMSERLTRQIAPLRAGEPNAEKGVLKYEHFSVVLNKSKRIAIYSATNIDGRTYLSVNRDTGEVSNGAEGDRWFIDPRISETFYLKQDFYSAWSHYFDRGHLTRRTDPTWGTEEEAERANADTFHFTNCAPQHFRFNQTARFWQGAERYVLENGVLAADSGAHIVVFQGPIFNNQIDLWADEFQIPSSYFKIIVWKGRAGLKSVGLVVDQLPLMGEERRNLGQPRDLPAVNVAQWRVPIKSIESRTGLEFIGALRDADTIRDEEQPGVGEALIAVRSLDDLLPRQR